MTEEITNAIITGISSVLVPVLIYALRRFLNYLERNYQIRVEQKTKTDLEWALTSAIHFAEEEARRRLTHGYKVVGEEKRDVARRTARSLMPDKLHYLADGQLNDLIDSRVNTLRPSMSPPPPPTFNISVAPPPMTTPLPDDLTEADLTPPPIPRERR